MTDGPRFRDLPRWRQVFYIVCLILFIAWLAFTVYLPAYG
jgi:uncharacterized membrane protein